MLKLKQLKLNLTALLLSVLVVTSAFLVMVVISYQPIKTNAQTTIPDWNFGTAGDWGCSSNTQTTVNGMVNRGIELNIGLGDYSYDTSTTCWFDISRPIDSKTKISIGNHDDETSTKFNSYISHYGIPSSQYYSFNYQNTHFTVISTEQSTSSGSSQYNFVNNELSKAAADPNIKWKVVYFHKPIYTSPTNHAADTTARNAMHPLFDKYGVDLVLMGHNHNFERSYPLKYNSASPGNPTITDSNANTYTDPAGQIYATVGTGGRSLYSFTDKASYIVYQQDDQFGWMNVEMLNSGTTMKGTYYTNDGVARDTWTINKPSSTPPPPPPESKYNYAPYATLSGSNYTQVSSTASLQLTTFSVASWFRTSTDFASNAYIVNKGGSGSDTTGQNMNYGISMSTTENIIAEFETRTGVDHIITSPNRYNDGQWHYAVATYDGTTTLRLYIDGVQVASKSTAGAVPDNTGTQPVRIGANSRTLNQYFTGNADEVRVWNRALTSTEVSNAYNSGTFNTNGQVLYLNFGTTPPPSNTPPVANAGPDQTVNETKSVTLSGRSSTDSDGTITSYSWRQTVGPTVTLNSTNTATVGFTAPSVTADTTLTFSLTVTDNAGASASDTVNVLVKNVDQTPTNQPPAANAGPDQTVNETKSVTLSGRSSTDSDGTITSYSWRQTVGPTVTLNSTNTATVGFNAPSVTADTTLTFSLTVTDNAGASASDTINVLVKNVDQTLPPPGSIYHYEPYGTFSGSNYTDVPSSSSLQLTKMSVASWFKT
ncbi:MAG: PKD domain-containing protein, partial [Thermoproteota archaeon]|nr:PKD domain-containing protein [Thermoproteota archaeon]